MISNGLDIVKGEFLCQHFRVAPFHAIDDSALSFVLADEADDGSNLFLFVQPALHSKREVGTVERGDECAGIIQMELVDDIRASHFVRCRCQRNDRDRRETLLQDGQLCILRAEIMPPMRNTMCFINCYQ